MTRPLPNPPRLDRWPAALRSAGLLHGTLVRCGPGVRGIGWPDTPRVRTYALAPWLEGRRIATHLTAAWVWGAARSPGAPLQVSVPRGFRDDPIAKADLLVHHIRASPHELTGFGDFAVTAPLRTALDLVYTRAEFDGTHLVACRLLTRLLPDGVQSLLRAFAEQPRRPHRRVARDRLVLVASR